MYIKNTEPRPEFVEPPKLVKIGESNNESLVDKVLDLESEVRRLTGIIEETINACDDLRNQQLRERCAEYDKGWRDCSSAIYHRLNEQLQKPL